jgi:hypothetical protein
MVLKSWRSRAGARLATAAVVIGFRMLAVVVWVGSLASVARADDGPPSLTPPSYAPGSDVELAAPTRAAAPAKLDIRLTAGVGGGTMRLSSHYSAAMMQAGLEGELWTSKHVALGLRLVEAASVPWNPNLTDTDLDHQATVVEPQLLVRADPRRFGPFALIWTAGAGLGVADVRTVMEPPGIPSDDPEHFHAGHVIASRASATGSIAGGAMVTVGPLAATAGLRLEAIGSDRAVTVNVGLGVAL